MMPMGSRERASMKESPGVLAAERRLRIMEQVAEKQSIHISALALEFGVSEMTARRDIARLERDGFLRRTYGGATAHVTRSFEPGFNARALQHAAEKRVVGMAAAGLVANATTIFLGIGTTAEQCARFLPPRTDLTVVTNSVPIASLLGTKPVQVIGLGGRVRRDELSFVGPIATATLGRYHFEFAIVGAAGISDSFGLTDLNDDEADVNRVAIARADQTMVIVDGSKLGLVAPAVVAPISAVHLVVTGKSAPGAEVSALRAAGVEVTVATVRAAPQANDPEMGPDNAVSN
jgi:DeoR/GlpR family transcriptional regulator of sugar metabolism